MVNRRDGQFARWLIGSMVDRSDSERLRGFCDGLMDRQTDICDSRVAFATENNILGGKPTHGKLCMFSADNF